MHVPTSIITIIMSVATTFTLSAAEWVTSQRCTTLRPVTRWRWFYLLFGDVFIVLVPLWLINRFHIDFTFCHSATSLDLARHRCIVIDKPMLVAQPWVRLSSVGNIYRCKKKNWVISYVWNGFHFLCDNNIMNVILF